jgi:hypothetical protein
MREEIHNMSKRSNILSRTVLFVVLMLSLILCMFTLNVSSRAVSASTDQIMIKDGASIRYKEPAGIRFSAYVSDELFDNVEGHVLKSNVEVGMYVVPAMYTDADSVTNGITSTSKGVKVVSSNPDNSCSNFVWGAKTKNEVKYYQQFNVVMKDIEADYYGEGILARAFLKVDNVTVAETETVNYSIREVANIVLAGNELEDEKLDNGQITALQNYVSATTALDAPVVSVLDGKASWESVENANGYLVKTSDGAIKRVASTVTEFDVSGKSSISVIALGDGDTYSYSATANKAVHVLSETQLATFDDESYFEDLSPSNPKFIDNAYFPLNGDFFKTAQNGNETPILRVNRADANGTLANGVEIGVPITAYQQAAARFSAFSIQLQKGLNLENFSGVKIRMNIINGWISGALASEFSYYLVGQDSLDQGYLSSTENVSYHVLDNLNTIFDWYIPSSDLKEYYETGDSLITLMVYFGGNRPTGGNVDYGATFGISVLLDDISYYTQLDTPENLSLSGNTLSWDAVENATSYVVKIGEQEIPVSTNNLDISSYLSSDVTIYVKAIANDYADSNYASKNVIYLSDGQLASFNSAFYESSVVTLEGTFGQKNSDGTKVTSATYTSSADGSDGALDITLKQGTNWKTNKRVFKVYFNSAVDLTNYDGISIKFKVYNYSMFVYTGTPNFSFKMLNKTGSNYSSTTYSQSISVGEWVTVKFTKEQVENSLVNDGTALTFMFTANGTLDTDYTIPKHTNTFKIYLDDISCYND